MYLLLPRQPHSRRPRPMQQQATLRAPVGAGRSPKQPLPLTTMPPLTRPPNQTTSLRPTPGECMGWQLLPTPLPLAVGASVSKVTLPPRVELVSKDTQRLATSRLPPRPLRFRIPFLRRLTPPTLLLPPPPPLSLENQHCPTQLRLPLVSEV